jgi:carboxyl-terminal processing protease
MSHAFRTWRVLTAGCLLGMAGASLASSPSPAEPTADELTISSLQDTYSRSVVAGDQADTHRVLLATVLQRIKRSHATQVDLQSLAAVAAKAMDAAPAGAGDPVDVFKKAMNEALRTLDPYSRYLDLRTQAGERGDSSGSFGGVGLELQPVDGTVRVVASIPGSPAARAGMAAGDLIVRVDDKPLEGVSLADAIERMRGQPGTTVALTVQRPGSAGEFTLSLTREIIRRQLLRSSMEGDVLVLGLKGFSGATSGLLAKAIADATAIRPPRAVVLDLRGNPGGLLREAVKVADAFLSEGEIASVRGSTPARQRTWQADADELLAGLPMVVLIDERSASASELVADALQHSGRATVMGQRSFGKGSVQTTFPLGEHPGALKLTTALYHGPSGETVHKRGVVPDVELLVSGRTEAARYANTDSLPEPRAAKAQVEPARCAPVPVGDPPLACAITYLGAGNIAKFMAGLHP